MALTRSAARPISPRLTSNTQKDAPTVNADPAAFVHPDAVVIGDVIIGPDTYIAPLASLRGDFGRIVVGVQVADGERSVEQQLLMDARAAEIRQAIEALPDKQKAAVLMHKYQGLGYAQISAALEVSESATKSLLFRAYETLRVRLAHMV